MGKTVSILIPTYNEKENIVPLVERIAKALAACDYEIIFIDDNSRDGTAEAVNSLAAKYPVRVIVRKDKRGLSSAVVDGLQYASSSAIIVMDADLQHPPEVLPLIVEQFNKGADLVTPSRYTPGGSCPPDWGFSRKMMSRVAGMMAHTLLPATRRSSDPMSGFFAFNKSVVEGAQLNPIGYKIFLEILMEGKFTKTAEVPYAFGTRGRGQSKLSTKTQIEYLKQLYSLMRRKGELIRFFKFIGVGLSGIVVNQGILALVTLLTQWHKYVAVIPGIEISIITNFLLNDRFTFVDRRSNKNNSFLKRILKFNLVGLTGAAINFGIYILITTLWGTDTLIIRLTANFMGIIVAFFWNYVLSLVWTWK